MVDDEEEFLQAVEPGLARRGFEVVTAGSGGRALELLVSRSFDVVVLDVKMPGIDGVDTFREIKRVCPGLPVILLTGHGNIQQAFETSREGVSDYLTKPCEVERLAQVLRGAVDRIQRSTVPETMGEEDVNLLIVDDDQDFVHSVTPALEKRGIRVTPASDGTDALDRARGRRFEVALVDMVMPDVDGLTLMDRLRREDPFLEIVILTGHPRLGDLREGLEYGAFAYLTKPQRVEDLVLVIRSARSHRTGLMEEERRAEIDRILANLTKTIPPGGSGRCGEGLRPATANDSVTWPDPPGVGRRPRRAGE
jgi:DNA-binding NtrC family response regulator